jgi:hypothetical protein
MPARLVGRGKMEDVSEHPVLRDSFRTQVTMKCPDTDQEFTLDYGPTAADYQKGTWTLSCPVCHMTHEVTVRRN